MNHDRLLQHQEMCSQRIIIINFSIEHFLNSFSLSQRDRQSVDVVVRFFLFVQQFIVNYMLSNSGFSCR